MAGVLSTYKMGSSNSPEHFVRNIPVGGRIQEITSISPDKERLKFSLVNRVLIVAGAAGSFAFEAGNNTLGEKFNVGFTHIQ
jgi:hypothetical protein